jgi:hypothetical protein
MENDIIFSNKMDQFGVLVLPIGFPVILYMALALAVLHNHRSIKPT